MIKDALTIREASTNFVKVKAHTGILWNEEADHHAGEACHSINFARLPNTGKLYPFQDEVMTDLNVRRLVKFQHKKLQREKVKVRLEANFSYLRISVDLSIESHKFLNDANVRAFRHKVMAKQLPTLVRNAKWSKEPQEEFLQTCRRCKEFKETNFHIWNCRHNDVESVRDTMIDWLRPRLSTHGCNQFTSRQLTNQLLSTNPFFSQGMITQQMKIAFMSLTENLPAHNPMGLAEKALCLSMAAFNHAFVKVCWLARNDAVHRELPPGDLHIRPIHDPPPLQPNHAPLNPRTNRKRTRETFLTSWNANEVFKSKQFVTRGNNDYVVQRPTMPITPMNRAQATM
jgi:hypothetical protein